MPEGCVSGTIRAWNHGHNLLLTQTHKPEFQSFLLATIRATCIVLDIDAPLPERPLVSEFKWNNCNHDVFEMTLDSVTLLHKRLVKVCSCYSHDRFCNSNGVTNSEGSDENDWDRRYLRWPVLFHQSQDACDCTDYALWSMHGSPQHTDRPSRGAQPRPITDALIWNQTAFHKAINLSTPPYVAS